jgi:hypothetical protein
MKKYREFLKEEAELRDTEGVPGDWMGKTDAKAERDLGVRKDFPGPQFHAMMGEMMGSLAKINSIISQTGSKDEIYPKLSQLALDAVGEEFPGVLDAINVDIAMVDMGDIPGEFEDFEKVSKNPKSKEQQAEEISSKKREQSSDVEGDEDDNENENPEEMKQDIMDMLNSSELKGHIDKRKLMNLVTQGEGLNTKKILHGDTIKNGLDEIFGDKSDEIFRLYERLIDINQKKDWVIPINHTASAMDNAPGGIAGACQVKIDKEDGSSQNNDDQESDESQNEGGQEQDGAYKLLVKVRGVDLLMLIHELVKGIYLAMSVGGLQSIEDDTMKMATKMSTSSFSDEAEDWRYGPYVAAELRDFINTCEGSDKVEGIRLYVFGRMVELPPEEFLPLMYGIFEKTSDAKSKIEEIISDINDQFDEYNRQVVEYDLEHGNKEDSDVQDVQGDDEEGDDVLVKIRKDNEAPRGYDKMSQTELNDVLNQLLDDENYTEVDKLMKYIKK